MCGGEFICIESNERSEKERWNLFTFYSNSKQAKEKRLLLADDSPLTFRLVFFSRSATFMCILIKRFN